MPSVDVNGQTIVYEDSGSGEPLLLVMGLGGQLIDWPEPFVEQLLSRYRVIRFDNRDIGLSSQTSGPTMRPAAMLRALLLRRKPASGYLISDMAADAVGLLNALSIDRAHIVGISMGGMICQQMAIDHPGRVLSMTSIMSNTGDRKNGRSAPALLAKAARLRPPTKETAVEEFVETSKLICGPHWNEADMRASLKASVARSFRPDGVARQFAAINASPDRTKGLATVTTPTLVIHGLIDPLVKPSGGIATAKAVPGSRLLMFPDMAHDLPRPRLGEIIDAINANAARAVQTAI
ncbi:MAG: alpha/beta hydrolase [Actinomycetota bacterium]